MRAAKRLEIIVDAIHAPEVLRILDAAGADGYTVIKDASGRGHRGERREDALTDVFSNWCVICACDPQVAVAATQKLQPLLRRYGGVCLVSDCEWLVH